MNKHQNLATTLHGEWEQIGFTSEPTFRFRSYSILKPHVDIPLPIPGELLGAWCGVPITFGPASYNGDLTVNGDTLSLAWLMRPAEFLTLAMSPTDEKEPVQKTDYQRALELASKLQVPTGLEDLQRLVTDSGKVPLGGSSFSLGKWRAAQCMVENAKRFVYYRDRFLDLGGESDADDDT